MKAKRPFTYKEFKSIYSKVPRLAVEVVILTPEGVVLTLRQEKSWRNQWHIPGGTVLYKESLERAVKRVAREEVRVEVKIKQIIGYIEYPSEEKERGFGWAVGIAFLCEIKSGQLPTDKEKIKVFKKIPQNIIKEQRKILREVLAKAW